MSSTRSPALDLRNSKEGICALCGRTGKLTRSHVFPQSGALNENLSITPVLSRIVKNTPHQKQGGLHFRSLCGSCNSYLGRHYDSHLIQFYASVRESIPLMPDVKRGLFIKANAFLLAKAVLGSAMAGVLPGSKDWLSSNLSKVLLERDSPLGDKLFIYYWFYPYRAVEVQTHIYMNHIRGLMDAPGQFHILKCEPIAFLITEFEDYEGLYCLNDYIYIDDPERISTLPIDLRSPHHQSWPNDSSGENWMMTGLNGANGVIGTRR